MNSSDPCALLQAVEEWKQAKGDCVIAVLRGADAQIRGAINACEIGPSHSSEQPFDWLLLTPTEDFGDPPWIDLTDENSIGELWNSAAQGFVIFVDTSKVCYLAPILSDLHHLGTIHSIPGLPERCSAIEITKSGPGNQYKLREKLKAEISSAARKKLIPQLAENRADPRKYEETLEGFLNGSSSGAGGGFFSKFSDGLSSQALASDEKLKWIRYHYGYVSLQQGVKLIVPLDKSNNIQGFLCTKHEGIASPPIRKYSPWIDFLIHPGIPDEIKPPPVHEWLMAWGAVAGRSQAAVRSLTLFLPTRDNSERWLSCLPDATASQKFLCLSDYDDNSKGETWGAEVWQFARRITEGIVSSSVKGESEAKKHLAGLMAQTAGADLSKLRADTLDSPDLTPTERNTVLKALLYSTFLWGHLAPPSAERPRWLTALLEKLRELEKLRDDDKFKSLADHLESLLDLARQFPAKANATAMCWEAPPKLYSLDDRQLGSSLTVSNVLVKSSHNAGFSVDEFYEKIRAAEHAARQQHIGKEDEGNHLSGGLRLGVSDELNKEFSKFFEKLKNRFFGTVRVWEEEDPQEVVRSYDVICARSELPLMELTDAIKSQWNSITGGPILLVIGQYVDARLSKFAEPWFRSISIPACADAGYLDPVIFSEVASNAWLTATARRLHLSTGMGAEQLRKWLEGFPSKHQQQAMVCLLRYFRFYDSTRIVNLLDQSLRTAAHTVEPDTTYWLTSLGHPNKSGPVTLGLAGKTQWVEENHTNLRFYDPASLRRNLFGYLAAWGDQVPGKLKILFLDDMSGSGGQLRSYGKVFFEDLKKEARSNFGDVGEHVWTRFVSACKDGRICFVCIYAVGIRHREIDEWIIRSALNAGNTPLIKQWPCENKIQDRKINEEIEFDGEFKFRAQLIIQDYTPNLSEVVDCILKADGVFSGKQESRLKGIIHKAWEQGYPWVKPRTKEHWLQFEPFGWKDTGGLVSTYFNCPGNTFPIIWGKKNARDGVTGEGLFSRSFNPFSKGSDSVSSVAERLEHYLGLKDTGIGRRGDEKVHDKEGRRLSIEAIEKALKSAKARKTKDLPELVAFALCELTNLSDAEISKATRVSFGESPRNALVNKIEERIRHDRATAKKVQRLLSDSRWEWPLCNK